MILSILVPTYNRSKYLLKNLDLLNIIISEINELNVIEIVISNNCSPDDTDVKVKETILKYPNLKIQYFNQIENIGLEKNALFVLNKAIGEFVMYLGDDDYLEKEYLSGVINHLQNNKNTNSIIPNFVPIDIFGKDLAKGRDDGLDNRVYKAGFKNCLINSWRGHQLSGLVLKREGLYDAYIDFKISNIYLFIFLLSYRSLNGDTYHFTKFPVRVSQPDQENKDWGYGDDGLLNEVFDNYIKLPVNYLEKSLLQLQFFRIQFWRLIMYKNKGLKTFLNVFFNIMYVKNGTFLFKIIYPFLAFFVMSKYLVMKDK
jgi:glycosyltransferase involved in cell wall biosynthesis